MKIMKSVRVGLYLAVTALGITTAPANATLMDQGGTTLDTATNLQWLDLTATLGQSYNSVIGGFGGFIAAGYRHATTAEVTQLFTNGGMTFQNGGNFPVDFAAAQFLVGLLGVTNTTSPYISSEGIAADPGPALRSPYVRYQPAFSTGAAFLGNIPGPATQSPFVGNYLVRNSPTAMSEPGTLAILGLGLAGLGFARRRKAAA